MTIKEKVINFLRWSEKYTGTDMVYIAKGGGFTFLANAGVALIAFIKMIVFGRFLAPESYGIYTYILSMVSLFGILSLPSIDTAIIRSIARKQEGTLVLALKTRLKWSLLGSAALMLIALWYFTQGNSFLAIFFLMGAAFLPPFNVFSIFNQFWQGKKRFEIYCKYELITDVLVTASVIGAILLTKNIIVIILTLFVSHSLFYGIILKKTIMMAENKEEDHSAISFGKNLTVMEAVTKIAEQIDKVIIWKFLGPIQVAVYSFAQLPIIKIQTLFPITTIALPKLGERNIKEIKSEILKKFKKLFVFAIPLSLLAFFAAPLFYKIVFPQYLDSIPYFQALTIILVFLPFSLLSSSLVSEMKKRELYFLNLIIPLAKIILFLALIPFLGVWGTVLAIIFAQILNGFTILYFFRKI